MHLSFLLPSFYNIPMSHMCSGSVAHCQWDIWNNNSAVLIWNVLKKGSFINDYLKKSNYSTFIDNETIIIQFELNTDCKVTQEFFSIIEVQTRGLLIKFTLNIYTTRIMLTEKCPVQYRKNTIDLTVIELIFISKCIYKSWNKIQQQYFCWYERIR